MGRLLEAGTDRVGEVDAESIQRGLELGLDRVGALAQGRRDLLDREIGVIAQDDRRPYLEGQVGDAVEEGDPG